MEVGSGESVVRAQEIGDRGNKKLHTTHYKLPTKLSFTQLKAFETCPLQYYYAHVIKIPGKGAAVFSFGQTMHSTLQQFFQLVIERSQVGQQTDLFSATIKNEEIGAKNKEDEKPLVSLKELLDIYELAWQDDWYFDEKNKQEYYTQGKEVLKDFYRQIQPKIPVPLFLEKGFNIKVGDYTLRGVIDRVDPAEEGKWRIIDYKTGKVKEKISFEDKKQLLIYQLAAKEIFQAETESLQFYYLNENKPLSFQATESDLVKVKSWIVETADAIKSSDFPPQPGNACQYCDFNQICPFAKK
jgi:RecB family exonuclease